MFTAVRKLAIVGIASATLIGGTAATVETAQARVFYGHRFGFRHFYRPFGVYHRFGFYRPYRFYRPYALYRPFGFHRPFYRRYAFYRPYGFYRPFYRRAFFAPRFYGGYGFRRFGYFGHRRFF